MSKSIWHRHDEAPKHQDIIMTDTGCWAYRADLLVLETENKDLSDKIGKLETELENTRKALDAAVDALEMIGSGDIIEHSVVGHENDNKIFIANKALNEIKTALEQKDHFANVSKMIEQKE